MKILYDHQAFTGQRYGGVARYFHDLMESLSKMGIGIELALQFSNNEYLKNSSKENFKTTNFKFHPFPVKIKHFLGILITNGFLQLLNIKEKFFSKMLIKFLQHCCDQIKVFINQCNKLCSKHNKEVSQLRQKITIHKITWKRLTFL